MVNNDVCEAAEEDKRVMEDVTEARDKEWWIIIKLQVTTHLHLLGEWLICVSRHFESFHIYITICQADRLGKYCSKIVVEQAELCEVCSHREQISVVSSALGAGQGAGQRAGLEAGHSLHICDCSAPECRGTGV